MYRCVYVIYLSTVAANDDYDDDEDEDGNDADAAAVGGVGDVRFCARTSLVNNCLA